MHRRGRRAGQIALLRNAAESLESAAQTRLPKACAASSTETVTVWPSTTGDTVAMRADLGRQRFDMIAAQGAQNLLRLLLHLLFFAADEAESRCAMMSMEGTPGIAGAGDGLHGGDDDALECRTASAVRAPWSTRSVEQLGLVTICPFQPRVRCWHGNQLQVIGIDLRHEQRNVALHAVVLRIGYHDVAGLGEGLLDFGRDRGVRG